MSHPLDGIELVPENVCPECGVDVNELTEEIDRLKRERDEWMEVDKQHFALLSKHAATICEMREELLKLQGDRKILREALIERMERDRRSGRDVS